MNLTKPLQDHLRSTDAWSLSMFVFGHGEVMGRRHVAMCGHICGAHKTVGWGDGWHALFFGQDCCVCTGSMLFVYVVMLLAQDHEGV